MKITRLNLNSSQKHLTIETNQKQVFTLSYEYLRVFTPQVAKANSATIIAHKKNVVLINIEMVGKHGFRFIFDDNHSAIFNNAYLEKLALEQTIRWQQYLSLLKASGLSREAMIDVKQL